MLVGEGRLNNFIIKTLYIGTYVLFIKKIQHETAAITLYYYYYYCTSTQIHGGGGGGGGVCNYDRF